ncbi:MAG: hypothetical protein Q9216_004235 [Gyalolechia sp. 2 TL-2023]
MPSSLDLPVIIRATFFAFLSAINAGSMIVADHVSDFVKTNDAELTLAIILAAIMPFVAALLEGIPTAFSKMDLDKMAQETFTSDQGVYGIIVFFRTHDGVYRLYIGSSFGKQGMVYRVHDCHFNASFRKRVGYKYLYRCMEHANAESFPVCLARFRQVEDPAIVLITEALMASLFGSYTRKDYQSIRHQDLPAVDWNTGVNQFCPLTTNGCKDMWKAGVSTTRRRKLENARAGGPVVVRRKNTIKWIIWVFHYVTFRIPRDVAQRWDLENDPIVNLHYDIAPGLHPQSYVEEAPMESDGRRLGIRVTKVVNGKLEEHWVRVGLRESAVKAANSLYDWITGAIGDDADSKDWGEDRLVLFGSQSHNAISHAKRAATQNIVPRSKPSSKQTPLIVRAPLTDVYLGPAPQTSQKGQSLPSTAKEAKRMRTEDKDKDREEIDGSSSPKASKPLKKSIKRETGYKEGKKLIKKGAKYDSAAYTLYDPDRHTPAILTLLAPPQKMGRNLDYSIFDNYVLYSNPYLSKIIVEHIPQSGVRLDDMAVGCVLASSLKRMDLTKRWPAEFDVAGLPRATRAPLGHAYKIRVNVGDKDVHGYTATAADAGFYVGWWRGLQPLMGKEGLDAGSYIVRPSHEKFLCEGFGWKKGWKCQVQQPAGSANDPTEGLILRGSLEAVRLMATLVDEVKNLLAPVTLWLAPGLLGILAHALHRHVCFQLTGPVMGWRFHSVNDPSILP